LQAAEHHGVVRFGGLPVPGATVTATQSEKRFTAVTSQQGFYSFADLPDGRWTIQVEMLCFAPLKRDVAPGAPGTEWELQLLPLPEMHAERHAAAPPPPGEAAPAVQPATPAKPGKKKSGPVAANTSTAFQRADPAASTGAGKLAADAESQSKELQDRAVDGLLINGSVNNGANSPFAQSAAFGNFRNNGRGLYNGSLSINAGNERLKTVPLKFSIPLGKLLPGTYDCQVTVLNPAARKAAFRQTPILLVP
jgi:hypothetical protein